MSSETSDTAAASPSPFIDARLDNCTLAIMALRPNQLQNSHTGVSLNNGVIVAVCTEFLGYLRIKGAIQM